MSKQYPHLLVPFLATVMLMACTLAKSVTPTAASPTSTSVPTAATPSPQSTGSSVVVAFVKDGNIQIWDEATNQSKTIFTSGDVTTVTASDDGQVIAFLRGSRFDQPELREQFALWAVDRDGKNPRELVSAETIRQRQNMAARDSSGFAELKWIPRTHRLAYNTRAYFLPGQGVSYSPDIYVVDADTLSDSVLASGVIPADRPFYSVKIIPSLDGMQLALITPTALGFINADGSNPRKGVLTYSEVGAGDAGPVMPVGVWTQDSSAFVITGSFEMDAQFNISFAIWRVPVDGSTLEQLATVSPSHPASVTFSPDGNHYAHIQYSDQQLEPTGWSINDLIGDVGPLAIQRDYEGGHYANVHWSPSGKAYTLNLSELCPNATKDSDVCATALNSFGGDIDAIHWIDGTRLLFVTRDPPVLLLGTINPPPRDGTAIPIIAWSSEEVSHSFTVITPR